MMRPFRRTLRRSFLVLGSFSSLLAIALALAVIAAFTFWFVERGQTLRIAPGPPRAAFYRGPSAAAAAGALAKAPAGAPDRGTARERGGRRRRASGSRR